MLKCVQSVLKHVGIRYYMDAPFLSVHFVHDELANKLGLQLKKLMFTFQMIRHTFGHRFIEVKKIMHVCQTLQQRSIGLSRIYVATAAKKLAAFPPKLTVRKKKIRPSVFSPSQDFFTLAATAAAKSPI